MPRSSRDRVVRIARATIIFPKLLQCPCGSVVCHQAALSSLVIKDGSGAGRAQPMRRRIGRLIYEVAR